MMAPSSSLLVILGATASGKSAVAMEMARETGAEILSVDSMQVYRGMDLGTAKPTAAERAAVRHHLIDVVDPNEPFTVARFVELADATIAQAAATGRPLIATGGTPLYYKALFEGLFDGPPADVAIRERLRAMSLDDLHARLTTVDPVAATRIHRNDDRRAIRALEVYELTGRSISSFQTDWSSPDQRHAAVWVGLTWEREALNRRINARVKQMIEAGWVDETRELLRQYGELSPTAAEATGYAELIAHLQGKLSLDDAVEQIKIATRQLAKRQLKWIRRFPNVTWIDGDQAMDALVAQVKARWRSGPSPGTPGEAR
jgi:tRNA dimethylallyltransferase